LTEVATIRVEADSLHELRDEAGRAEEPLLWLLDKEATPSERALAVLLEHAPGPVASLPVDEHGHAVEPLMGRTTESDVDGILDAAIRHQLPLRHIALTSLLVERDLVLELAAPDPRRFGRYAGAEWTARLFEQRRGMLVPASRVRAGEWVAGSPIHVLRTARRAKWRTGETVRELHRAVKRGMR
jgi:hypothetical protein